MYNRAARSGHVRAQSQLGVAYQFSLFGLTIDNEEALKWYRQAAEGCNAGAQRRLAEAYKDGDLGLLTDEMEAKECTRRRRRATP